MHNINRYAHAVIIGDQTSTGFAVAHDLVLTALHAIWPGHDGESPGPSHHDDPIPVKVGAHDAILAWPLYPLTRDMIDAALLRVPEGTFGEWLVLHGEWPVGLAFDAAGYPGTAGGGMVPITGTLTLHGSDGILERLSCKDVPPHSSLWAGISGAPVVVAGRVVGLVVRRVHEWPHLLDALPAAKLLALPKFREVLPSTSIHTATVCITHGPGRGSVAAFLHSQLSVWFPGRFVLRHLSQDADAPADDLTSLEVARKTLATCDLLIVVNCGPSDTASNLIAAVAIPDHGRRIILEMSRAARLPFSGNTVSFRRGGALEGFLRDLHLAPGFVPGLPALAEHTTDSVIEGRAAELRKGLRSRLPKLRYKLLLALGSALITVLFVRAFVPQPPRSYFLAVEARARGLQYVVDTWTKHVRVERATQDGQDVRLIESREFLSIRALNPGIVRVMIENKTDNARMDAFFYVNGKWDYAGGSDKRRELEVVVDCSKENPVTLLAVAKYNRPYVKENTVIQDGLVTAPGEANTEVEIGNRVVGSLFVAVDSLNMHLDARSEPAYRKRGSVVQVFDLVDRSTMLVGRSHLSYEWCDVRPGDVIGLIYRYSQ